MVRLWHLKVPTFDSATELLFGMNQRCVDGLSVTDGKDQEPVILGFGGLCGR